MPIIKTGDWDKVRRILSGAPQRIERAIDRATHQEAQFLRAKIVEGIRTQEPGGQAFEPLSPITIAIRQYRGFKGTKALIRTAGLRNSITVFKDGDSYFVGIKRTARTTDGKALVDIARLHEEGKTFTMRVTDKARKFLAAALRAAGIPRVASAHSQVAVIRIPARPFLGPIEEKYMQPEDVAQRYMQRVSQNLLGDFGGFATKAPVR